MTVVSDCCNQKPVEKGAKVPTPFEQLQALLNNDAPFPKEGQLVGGGLADVVSEIRQDRHDAAKKAAKELIVKAMDLVKQGNKIKSDFDKAMKKHDEELGKIMKQINAISSGNPIATTDENKEVVAAVKEEHGG